MRSESEIRERIKRIEEFINCSDGIGIGSSCELIELLKWVLNEK